MSHVDPPTKQSKKEVQKIINLQDLANRLPDAFVDSSKATKSHIPVANVPSRIEIPMGKLEGIMTNEPKPQLKRGRPLGSKDTSHRKRRNIQIHALEKRINIKGLKEIDLEPQVDELITPEEVPIKWLSFQTITIHNNEEIPINYVYKGKIWDRSTTLIDYVFSFQVAMDIINNDEGQEPQNVNECQQRHDWLPWKEAMQTKLKSLAKRNVFGSVIQTPTNIKPVRY